MFLIADKYWEIKTIPKKGRGVFAKTDILPGCVIGDYLGKVVRTDEVTSKDQNYTMGCNNECSILPDIPTVGIHYINHSCAPNCAMFMYRAHTLYYSLRHIFKEEELTVCYLLGSPTDEDVPCQDVCYCATPVCRGTMHNSEDLNQKFYSYVKKHQPKFFDRIPVDIGSYVKPLEEYPEIISDNQIFDIFGSLKHEPFISNETTMPSLKEIRRRIRETGKLLRFPHIGIEVYGVMSGLLVSRYI